MITINRILAITVFLVAAMMTYAPSIMAATSVKHIQDLIANEQLSEALRLTNEELARPDANINYRFLKGLILIRLNQLEQAADVFTAITRDHPELPEPYNNLAVIYAAMGDLDKARQALQEAINTHPSYATAHENIGDIYARLASEAYNQALQLDQENVTAKAKLSLINDLFSVPGPEEKPVLAEATQEQPEPESAMPLVDDSPAAPPAKQETAEPEKKPEDAVDEQVPEREIVAAVEEAVSAWKQAWSSQDVEAYLSRYGGEFTPPAGQSLAEWKEERKVRLAEPRYIRVEISDIQVEPLGENHAQATFTQRYQSDTYGDLVSKLLLFAKKEGRWLIVQEATR